MLFAWDRTNKRLVKVSANQDGELKIDAEIDGVIDTRPNILTYLDGEKLSLDGSNASSATIPENTRVIVITSPDTDVQYQIDDTATSNSPGYVVAGSTVVLEVDCESLSFISSIATSIYIQYFSR